MPVVWNAETEAKLLAGLFKVCDVKVSGQQLKELAEIIGPECTPKAITHRIAKMKTAAGALNGGGKKGGGDGESEPATPKSGKKKTPKGKKRKAAEIEDDAADEEEDGLKMAKVEEVEDE